MQVSASPADLEILKQSIGEIPKEGKDLVLPNPFGIGGPARFKGVKFIESVPSLKEDEYILRLKTESRAPVRRSLLNRLKNLF